MNPHAEQQLVKLSAEALVLRQRVAQLQKENRQLRAVLDHRNTIGDIAKITIRKDKQNG